MNYLTYLVSCPPQNADVLQFHSLLLDKYWADCPYQKMAVINDDINSTLYNDLKYDKLILSGRTTNTITRITYALQNISTPYVLLMHDDFLLYSYVDTQRIKDLVSYMIYRQAVLLSLAPHVPNNYHYDDKNKLIREVPHGVVYRYNLAAGIWEKDFLCLLLDKYTSIWELERKASFDKDVEKSTVLQTDYSGLPYIESVGRGKWRPQAVHILANAGVFPDLENRHVQSHFDILKNALAGFIFNLNPDFITKVINYCNIGYKAK